MLKKFIQETCTSFFASNFDASSCQFLYKHACNRAEFYRVQETCRPTKNTRAYKKALSDVQVFVHVSWSCVRGINDV